MTTTTNNNIQFTNIFRCLSGNNNNCSNLNPTDIDIILTPKQINDENSIPDIFGNDTYTRFIFIQYMMARNSGVVNMEKYKLISFICDDKKNDKTNKKNPLQKIAIKKFNIAWNILKVVPIKVYNDTDYLECSIINNYILIPEIIKFNVQIIGYFTAQKPFGEVDTTLAASSKSPKLIFLASKDSIDDNTKIFLNNIGLNLTYEFNKYITSTTINDFNKNKLRFGNYSTLNYNSISKFIKFNVKTNFKYSRNEDGSSSIMYNEADQPIIFNNDTQYYRIPSHTCFSYLDQNSDKRIDLTGPKSMMLQTYEDLLRAYNDNTYGYWSLTFIMPSLEVSSDWTDVKKVLISACKLRDEKAYVAPDLNAPYY